ncbi:hypothetical protein Pint_10371 [Pistacia integerrima]|uniref:Uncharacterized protein n=1 Tax=Pistacia integerrima TaxID=434235 RepID=A0ACC0XJ34_9ROSI|nr:hypothetical protein Pint_10371 [Pistacia integerrima]
MPPFLSVIFYKFPSTVKVFSPKTKKKKLTSICIFGKHNFLLTFIMFYNAEADMRRERERKDQESKRNQKVEFIAGGVQPGIVAAAPKPNIPVPVLNANDAAARDGRQNKKSKWDKVDGDRKNPLSTVGQDSLSAAGAHAAILSAANAGSGYTAFA